MLDEADQVPPAFWQSAWLVIVESDEPLPDEPLPDEPRPDGLADGDVDDPEEEPDDGVDIEPLLEPEPVVPVLPELDPVLPPVLPPVLLPVLPPVLLPPLVCAAASAGAKQTIPIKTRVRIFFIRLPPCIRAREIVSADTRWSAISRPSRGAPIRTRLSRRPGWL